MKKFLCILLVILTLLSLCAFSAGAASPQRGMIAIYYRYDPQTGADLGKQEESGYISYEYKMICQDNLVHNDAVKGVTYDDTTNTLTLTDFDNAGAEIYARTMGDDFKINIVGECRVSNITLESGGRDESASFVGDGTLTVNPLKKAVFALEYYCFDSDSRFIFSQNVKVNLYGDKYVASMDSPRNTDDPSAGFVFNGAHNGTFVMDSYTYPAYNYVTAGVFSLKKASANQSKTDLGLLVSNPDDPDGIYTVTNGSISDGGNYEEHCYVVNHILYDESLDAYYSDPDFSGDPGSIGLWLTDEEFEASVYNHYVTDEYGNQTSFAVFRHIYESGYRLAVDKKGNQYVYAFSEIAGKEIFAPLDRSRTFCGLPLVQFDMDLSPEGITLTDEFERVYILHTGEEVSYSYVGDEVRCSTDPDGFYTAVRDYQPDPEAPLVYTLHSWEYSDELQCYLDVTKRFDTDRLSLTEEEWKAKGYTFVKIENISENKMVFLKSYYVLNEKPIYTDESGNYYCMNWNSGDNVAVPIKPYSKYENTYIEDLSGQTLSEDMVKPLMGEGQTNTVFFARMTGSEFHYVGDPSSEQPTQPSPQITLGDTDGDGVISVLDATRIQKFKASLCNLDGSAFDGTAPSEALKNAADVDQDGVVSVLDATRIQKYKAHLCGLDGAVPYHE